jgi:hypothetical protein
MLRSGKAQLEGLEEEWLNLQAVIDFCALKDAMPRCSIFGGIRRHTLISWVAGKVV